MLRGCGEGRAVADTLARVVTAPPRAVVSKSGSIEELADVVRSASRVRPAGGMTWLSETADFTVNTSRLNQIIEHEPADLIAVAQAGVTLKDFNAKLAENGQWLPLDPPDDGRATLGGIVATGLGGAQQFGYGRPRGSVIGMKVVLADGSVIKTGGRVVKNVAGYDLTKLFTGSYGTLGVIVELNFKLRPRPEYESTVIVDGSIVDLTTKARSIVAAGLFPVAAEIVSPAFASLLDITTNQPVMLVRFAGNQDGVKFQIERTLALCEGGEVIADDAQLWQQLAAAPLRYESGWHASVLPTELAAVCKTIDVPDALWQVGAADGRIRMLDNRVENPVTDRGNAGFLMDRVKQQLDPTNKFGA